MSDTEPVAGAGALAGSATPEAGFALSLVAIEARGRTDADVVRELCHDLRHPSATIKALVAAIELGADLSAQAKGRLHQIAAEARRIDELCLKVLRAEDHADLSRVDRVAADVVRAAAARRQRIDLVASPVLACIDDLSLRRILWNLVDNAARTAGPAGRVLVAAWSTNDDVLLEVSDNGARSGDEESPTAAFGLAIVRSLAASHGGTVEVRRGDSGGTAVRVVLPPPRLAVGFDAGEAAPSRRVED